MTRAAVERFVRDTLGCRCPDELFRNLRTEPANETHDGAIVVGGRLLVVVLRGGGELEERLLPLLATGRERRDKQGFHRLRLVAVTEEPACAKALQQLFDHSPLRDERIHLHFIASRDLPKLD